MVRATAANAQIRAFACTTRETVETARVSHNTSPVVTAALGRLLSAGAMMGSMLKGDDELITLQIKGDGPIGGLTVTADMNGHVKGYANVPDVILPANAQETGCGRCRRCRCFKRDPRYGTEGSLCGTDRAADRRDCRGSDLLFCGIRTGTFRGRTWGIDEQRQYRETGRRFHCTADALCGRGNDQQTGGEYQESLFRYYYAGCRQDSGGMLEVLLSGMDLEITDTLPVEFACNCSKDRVRKALISIGREELQSMIDDGETIEVNCHFCNKNYNFTVDELKQMIQ